MALKHPVEEAAENLSHPTDIVLDTYKANCSIIAAMPRQGACLTVGIPLQDTECEAYRKS